jgi:hypothetical protein
VIRMYISHELPVENELVAKPPKKSIWKSLIMKAVERYWAKKIRKVATWYPSLEHLNSEIYKPKLYHSILDIHNSQTGDMHAYFARTSCKK